VIGTIQPGQCSSLQPTAVLKTPSQSPSTNSTSFRTTHVSLSRADILQQLQQTKHVPSLPSSAFNAVETQTTHQHQHQHPLNNYHTQSSFGGNQTEGKGELENRSDARWNREGTAERSSDTRKEIMAEHSLLNSRVHLDARVKSSLLRSYGLQPGRKGSRTQIAVYQWSRE